MPGEEETQGRPESVRKCQGTEVPEDFLRRPAPAASGWRLGGGHLEEELGQAGQRWRQEEMLRCLSAYL